MGCQDLKQRLSWPPQVKRSLLTCPETLFLPLTASLEGQGIWAFFWRKDLSVQSNRGLETHVGSFPSHAQAVSLATDLLIEHNHP